MQPLDGLPTWLLSRSAARAHRLLVQYLGAAGYSGYEYRVLAAATALGESSQTEIGRAVALDRRDVTSTVQALEARGLLVRRPDPSNATAVLVQLTATGAGAFSHLEGVMQSIQSELLAPLSDEEASTLLILLDKVAKGG